MKSGSLNSALKLFDEMPERDAITWNIMISGYYRYGFLRQSLSLYNQMVFHGIVENSSTYSIVLSLCSYAGFFREGVVVHCRAIILGLSMNVYIGSALVDLYLQMGLFDIALRLFSALQDRNLATWNVVLRGICEMGRSKEVVRIYNDMKVDGLEPNGLTFCYLIRGCGYERFLDEGMQLHCCVIKKGLVNSNLFVAMLWLTFTQLVGDSLKLGNHLRLSLSSTSFLGIQWFQFVHRMVIRILLLKSSKECIFMLALDTLLVQSALIDMYGKCGDIESSVSIFDTAPERTLESCNPLMTSLLRFGLIEDVIELFCLMVNENIGYDEVSLSSTLKALSATGTNSACCCLLHSCTIKSGFESDIAVSCSLIDAYSKSSEVKLSSQVFDQISPPNVVCFTSMISALARNGMGMECFEMFDRMIQSGLKPDKVAFLSVLMGCNHSGLVEGGKLLFHSMHSDHGLHPERQHYSCMVDLLGRAGSLDEVEELLKGTTWEVDFVIWSSILRSCRIHQSKEVGKRAAYMLMELEPENPAGWLQASNFYSDIGDFETMKRLREVLVARKMRREIGTESDLKPVNMDRAMISDWG
ncbi:hypothetical protein BUALT_Bualt05G0158000 [Buddleja alternifolia]|uniref:Pentatricopeptide repeat-containing protein n=1 Tax=Buddleja alternifolia TaxID=168488 RepID=A0AAV6XSS7_9LAMI|nr:hypothetical protein BUALT_Bualt05G0158000 [Buddleja alternifolia]